MNTNPHYPPGGGFNMHSNHFIRTSIVPLALLTACAAASPVTITDVYQDYNVDLSGESVNGDAGFFGSVGQMGPNVPGTWDIEDSWDDLPYTSGNISHHSFVSESLFSIDASIDSFNDPGDIDWVFYSVSTFQIFGVDFILDETTTFELDATLSALGPTGDFISSIAIFQPGGAGPFEYREEVTMGELTLNETFTLDPGVYRFAVSGVSGYGDSTAGSGATAFNATFAVVPAPASAPLLLAGCLPLSRRRRPST